MLVAPLISPGTQGDAGRVAPIDELFSQLTAPDRLLVIDAAEGAAEDRGEVFSYLLRRARGAGLKVIAVAVTEGAGAATQLMRSGPTGPREFVVPGLDDEELGTAAAHIPLLQVTAEATQRGSDWPRCAGRDRRTAMVAFADRSVATH